MSQRVVYVESSSLLYHFSLILIVVRDDTLMLTRLVACYCFIRWVCQPFLFDVWDDFLVLIRSVPDVSLHINLLSHEFILFSAVS